MLRLRATCCHQTPQRAARLLPLFFFFFSFPLSEPIFSPYRCTVFFRVDIRADAGLWIFFTLARRRQLGSAFFSYLSGRETDPSVAVWSGCPQSHQGSLLLTAIFNWKLIPFIPLLMVSFSSLWGTSELHLGTHLVFTPEEIKTERVQKNLVKTQLQERVSLFGISRSGSRPLSDIPGPE